MKISIRSKKNDPVRDLEKYYNNIRKGFTRQLSNLHVDEYFQSSRKRFYAFLKSTGKKIRKEEKRFYRLAWVKDIRKGKFISKRSNELKTWYNKQSPDVYKWADKGLNRFENTVEYSYNQTKNWVSEKTPELADNVVKGYRQLGKKASRAISDYKSARRRRKIRTKIQSSLGLA